MIRRLAVCLLAAIAAHGAMRVLVTVVEQKSSKPVENIKAEEFAMFEDKLPRRIEAVEFSSKPIDVMLMVDTSMLGEMVHPVASALIGELKEKEQMAIVAFDSSAEMIQDFTSSKQALGEALNKVKYGNTPRVLDAMFAAMEGGFDHAVFRRVIFVVTAGLEGNSRTDEKEVIRLARKNGVSIYPIFATGVERGMFQAIARGTGGATFNLRDLQRAGFKTPATRIFETARSNYTLTITGNLGLGEKVRVEVKRPDKLLVSALPLD